MFFEDEVVVSARYLRSLKSINSKFVAGCKQTAPSINE